MSFLGKLNEQETVELAGPLIAQGRKELLENWLKEVSSVLYFLGFILVSEIGQAAVFRGVWRPRARDRSAHGAARV